MRSQGEAVLEYEKTLIFKIHVLPLLVSSPESSVTPHLCLPLKPASFREHIHGKVERDVPDLPIKIIMKRKLDRCQNICTFLPGLKLVQITFVLLLFPSGSA